MWAAVAALVVLTTLGWTTRPTSATWTAPAYFAASASSGSWQAAAILPGPGVSVSYTWWVGPVYSSGAQVCASVTVSTTSATPVPWSFDLDLTAPPWNGATSGYNETIGAQQELVGSTRYRISGTADWILISAGHPRVDQVCNYSLPPIPASSSAGFYTVTTTQGPDWTTTTACLTTTVTGNGSQPFSFEWTAPLDLSSALAKIRPRAGRVQQTGGTATIAPTLSPQQSSYTISSGWAGAIKGTDSAAVTVCAYRY